MSSIRAGWWAACLGGTVGLLLTAGPAAAQGGGGGGGSSAGLGSSGGGSLLGSSSGGSLLGSSSGGSLLGSSSGSSTGSSFIGMSSTGGAGTGSGYGASGSRGGGFSGSSIFPQVPSTQNPFRTSYYNPLAQGQSIISMPSMLGTSTTGTSKTSAGSFGNPTLGTTTTTQTTRRGTSSLAGGASASGSLSTIGMTRGPSYTTTLGFTPPRLTPARLLNEATQVLARSSSLSPSDNIQVRMDGETVVLTGSVAAETDRHLAEMLVRITPGIREVRNELAVRPAPAASP